MLKHVTVRQFSHDLGNGQSKPLAVVADNSMKYVIKTPYIFNQTKQLWEHWNAVMIQEILVFHLAEYLGITIPTAVVAKLDSSILPAQYQGAYRSGLYFASEWVPDIEDNMRDGTQLKQSWMQFLSDLHNADEIPKIVALDLLTANFDRFGNGENIIVSKQGERRLLQIIDQGDCFWGYTWEGNSKLNAMKLAGDNEQYKTIFYRKLMVSSGKRYAMCGLGEVFRALDQHIDVSDSSSHSFVSVYKKICSLTVSQIKDWLDDIPESWFYDHSLQSNLYIDFLVKQIKLLPDLISTMASCGAFSSWRGNELHWEKDVEYAEE
ncbi:hypothetical protein YSY43_07440 [Paenibacillus sp. YSY-4.3]